MTNEERIAAVHKALNDAGYDAVYGNEVRPGWRIEGYNGPSRNLIVEYIWSRRDTLDIHAYTDGPFDPESPGFAEWLKS